KLMTEFHGVNVRTGTAARGCWPARNSPVVGRRISPAIWPRQIASPSWMGHAVVIVGAVHVTGQEDLLDVIDINRVLGLVFCFGERGQEHPGEDGNNGNDDEQFDERKRPLLPDADFRRNRFWLLHRS